MARTNRELVMLADTYVRAKHRSAGMYMSEKLDGMRCLWLPASRGKRVGDLPFANTGKDTRNHMASGLWTRYGKVIHCPSWFVEGFPNYPLDGELYLGRKKFEELMSVTKRLEPVESDWRRVSYLVFDAPKYKTILATGRINNPQWSKNFVLENNLLCLGVDSSHPHYNNALIFDATYKLLVRDLKPTETMRLHEQVLLPFSTPLAIQAIDAKLKEVVENDGEGLILRMPGSMWEPVRSPYILKVKPWEDAEATVVGFRAGTGKYLGMLGSVTVHWKHGTFEIGTGFTDEQRLLSETAAGWAAANPGELFPMPSSGTVSLFLPYKEEVTFRYRELTEAQVPKEGRFLRKVLR